MLDSVRMPLPVLLYLRTLHTLSPFTFVWQVEHVSPGDGLVTGTGVPLAEADDMMGTGEAGG